MRVIQKELDLQKADYYITHLAIVNAILPIKLTPKEIEVLANFMALEVAIAQQRFGTTARKIIKKNMNLSDGGLSNYLRAFKDKGFVDNNQIHPILIPNPEEQIYQFKLKVNEESIS